MPEYLPAQKVNNVQARRAVTEKAEQSSRLQGIRSISKPDLRSLIEWREEAKADW